MDGGWTQKDFWQTVFYGVQAFGVILAACFYFHQSRKLTASEKQANRARLTEAYMNWHNVVLAIDKNTILSGKMIRRGHILVRDEHDEIHEELAREVHLLCLLLNTMFLEWNYRNTYDQKEKTADGYPALNATIDNLLTGVVINSHKHYTHMINSFDVMFPDFPQEFRKLIKDRIEVIRTRHAAALAKGRQCSKPDCPPHRERPARI